MQDILYHDDYLVKDSVWSGSAGAIYRPWVNGSDYHDEISASIKFQHWLQAKRV